MDGEAGTTVAERSTAAVDVADNSGDEPLTAKADQSTADGVAQKRERDTESEEAQGSGGTERPGKASPPELHSGHKLARRYRLEECVTRLDGFSSWRAVDEKLRRAVGVHLLPADHSRARSVLAAARSSALLGDPRFVQVLDAVEENDLVYVVHEWLPDATELTTLLAAGPLEVHDAYQMVSQVSQAMAAAHREGLAHLRLTPGAVLRTSSSQWRIRGLAVNAALRGISSDTPQRTDTEAIGALLYAALTQRWPYDTDAYGLSGLPKGVGLIAPDQVRAGVHRGLSELTMRALANDGATASRHETPCTTSEELVKAINEMPRIRPPEPAVHRPAGVPAHVVPAGHLRPPSTTPGRDATHSGPAVPSAEPHRQGPQVGRVGSAHRRAGPRQLAARGRAHGPGQVRGHEPDSADGRQRQVERQGQAGRADHHQGRAGIRRERRGPGGRRCRPDVRRRQHDILAHQEVQRGSEIGALQARRGNRLRPRLGPGDLGRLHRAALSGRPHDDPLVLHGLTVSLDIRRGNDGDRDRHHERHDRESDGSEVHENAVRAAVDHRCAECSCRRLQQRLATSKPSRT